jgi:hypothetical protein
LYYQVKQKQALLESNLPGIYLMVDKNVSLKGYRSGNPFVIFKDPYALKNSSINFCFLATDKPL